MTGADPGGRQGGRAPPVRAELGGRGAGRASVVFNERFPCTQSEPLELIAIT